MMHSRCPIGMQHQSALHITVYLPWLQELKQKLESWTDDGWLEQCCANLAEQLRIAQAENAELQQEVEALRWALAPS